MNGTRRLTPSEARRCVEFLRVLGIVSPSHPVLRERGYFTLFLNGVQPSEISTGDMPTSAQEFRQTMRLLGEAGVDQLRALIASTLGPQHPGETKRVSPPSRDIMRPRASSANIPMSRLRREARAALERETPHPPTAGGTHPTSAGTHHTPETRPSSDTHHRPSLHDAPPSATRNQSLRASSTNTIRILEPTEEQRAHYRDLGHAQSIREALERANELAAKELYHDAYYLLVDFLIHHPVLEERLIDAATEVVHLASRHDRDQGRKPENMLYECEEMAAVLARRIPDIAFLKEFGDERTARLYHIVRTVYKTWMVHCRALLEYRYRLNRTTYMRRNWIDPRDFGFLVEAMRMGVRTRLPLDLLREIYSEIRLTVAIGRKVIAHEDKRARFEGDVLRIIASPTKDIIIDLCLDIYKDIITAYVAAGDTQNALIFVKQALHIRGNDTALVRLRNELQSKGATGAH